MNLRRWACVALAVLAGAVAAMANEQDIQRLNQKFQAAVAQYDAGHLAEASAQLENLLHDAPNSFEVHELLGLVYASESKADLAARHLREAVRLNPNSAAARTNFATCLIHSENLQGAEEQLKKAVALEPRNFNANHNLGEVYVRMGKVSEAVPYLKQARAIDGSSYENGYDLAVAYLATGKPAPAKEVVQSLLERKNTAELHNLLAQIEEKQYDYVSAVTDYETAAHEDPSESNLFDWGSELLLHQTLEPAIEVFRDTAERYPSSTRVAIGLGIAYYSRGIYDEAVKSLLRAADLSPSDPRCYLFLSKAYDSSPGQAGEVIQKFRHFAELQPGNPRASYYYAMSLWKGKREQDPSVDFQHIEELLKKAVALDPKLSEAHLQLGNLYCDQTHYAEAIPEYLKALETSQDLPDAHYRLGQAYVHTGQKDKAQAQFAVYQEQRARQLADLDKQRAEIRQFVYSEEKPARN